MLAQFREFIRLDRMHRIGGLFVAADPLLDIGTRLTLHLHIESSGERLEVPAEVVSHNVGPNYGSEAGGMGLRFLDMELDVRKMLESLYDETLRRELISRAEKPA
ncbi:MAG: PilZ domain-containing protein [Myxococcota bacterium]